MSKKVETSTLSDFNENWHGCSSGWGMSFLKVSCKGIDHKGSCCIIGRFLGHPVYIYFGFSRVPQ